MRYLALPLLAFVLLQPAVADAQNAPVEIEEWNVTWEDTRPRDPYVAPDGRVWFVGQAGHYIAALDPESGEFERIDLDDGVGPHNLIVDSEGTIWYAGNRAAHIGRVDAETGEITKIAMPDPEAVRDPHTMIFDSNEDIWFTAQGSNVVGKLERATGEVQIVEVPTPRARPYGIVVDADDRPWIAEVGTNKIGTVDPATMEYREYDLPREEARPRRIAVTSDGAVWYVDYAQGHLGRLDPETGTVEEYLSPGGEGSQPYAMAVDDEDRLWFVETQGDQNRLIGFDAASREFVAEEDIPSGGDTVRHMVYHAETGVIWFGTDDHTIGRALVSDAFAADS